MTPPLLEHPLFCQQFPPLPRLTWGAEVLLHVAKLPRTNTAVNIIFRPFLCALFPKKENENQLTIIKQYQQLTKIIQEEKKKIFNPTYSEGIN